MSHEDSLVDCHGIFTLIKLIHKVAKGGTAADIGCSFDFAWKRTGTALTGYLGGDTLKQLGGAGGVFQKTGVRVRM